MDDPSAPGGVSTITHNIPVVGATDRPGSYGDATLRNAPQPTRTWGSELLALELGIAVCGLVLPFVFGRLGDVYRGAYGQLLDAQADGDHAAIAAHDLPILRVHLGADPEALLVALALPARTEPADVFELYEGLNEPGVPLLGGDTVAADRVILAVVALGRSERVPGRAGAKPGRSRWIAKALS